MKTYELSLIYRLRKTEALMVNVFTLNVDASLDLMRASANDLAAQLGADRPGPRIGDLCAMNLREVQP